MRYFPLTNSEREEIKNFLGIKDTNELFSDIPKDKSYYPLNDIPSALTEDQLLIKFKELTKKNKYSKYLSFLGAGSYNHFIPEVVNYLINKGELSTPYTPYQAEVSQGSLQGIFEYQTMITMLTGMDISNSSLYDGGTAAAEGVLLALRKSKKNRILIASNLHPEYIEIIHTYIQNLDFEAEFIEFDRESGKIDLIQLKEKIDENCGGFIFQSPNFLGVIEEVKTISDITHSKNAFSVQVTAEAMSLAFLTPAAENDVYIIVGEAQSFGIPIVFGGPYLGFIGAKKEFLRQMPGRIVGQTIDTKGRKGYVLTLSTREQHIKREKATSNICSNQALCALRAAIYLSTMGQIGLKEVSKTNHLNTAYFVKEASKLTNINIKFKKDFYNEVVIKIKNRKVEDFIAKLEEKKIIAGVPLKYFYPDFEDSILVNFTEIHKKKDIDEFINAIGEIE